MFVGLLDYKQIQSTICNKFLENSDVINLRKNPFKVLFINVLILSVNKPWHWNLKLKSKLEIEIRTSNWNLNSRIQLKLEYWNWKDHSQLLKYSPIFCLNSATIRAFFALLWPFRVIFDGWGQVHKLFCTIPIQTINFGFVRTALCFICS